MKLFFNFFNYSDYFAFPSRFYKIFKILASDLLPIYCKLLCYTRQSKWFSFIPNCFYYHKCINPHHPFPPLIHRPWHIFLMSIIAFTHLVPDTAYLTLHHRALKLTSLRTLCLNEAIWDKCNNSLIVLPLFSLQTLF